MMRVNSRGLNVSFKQDADSHLNNGLDASLLVLLDLVEADIVLSIAGIAKLRHGNEETDGGMD